MKLIRFACVSLFACGNVVHGSASDAAAQDAAAADASAPIDAAAACGDGHRDRGEICFGAPITFNATDTAYDAHLADVDGDGALDLVYLTTDHLVFHAQSQGQFPATGINGPTVAGTYAIALQLNTSPVAELVVAGAALTTYVRPDQGAYAQASAIAMPAGKSCEALAAGKVTGGMLPDVATVYGSAIHLAQYAANLTATEIPAGGAGVAVPGANGLAIGALDSDAYADVVVSGQGINFLRGGVAGLGGINATPQTAVTDAVALGDLNGDHVLDIAFVEADAGRLSTMIATGTGGFLAPSSVPVDSIGQMIDTADIDGDGLTDVITVRKQSSGSAVIIALGRADGTLAPPVALAIPLTPDYLHADADYNGDGVNDIVVTDIHRKMITILTSTP